MYTLMTEACELGKSLGVIRVDAYYSLVQLTENGDATGEIALKHGSRCYQDALALIDANHAEARFSLFQAAEYLYRIAVAVGDSEEYSQTGVVAKAYLLLGYLYYYDRLDGCYYPDFRAVPYSEEMQNYCNMFDRERECYECFVSAMEHGNIHAYYKIGDLFREGIGCNADHDNALHFYKCAYLYGSGMIELPKKTNDSLVWGSAALRIAECFEQGLGVNHDFALAYSFYKRAQAGLRDVCEEVDWSFFDQLRRANCGLKRCRREMLGEF